MTSAELQLGDRPVRGVGREAGDPVKEDAAVAELLDRRVDGINHAAMSLRRVRVPEGLHRTHSVLANCLPEDDSLPAVVPAERAGRARGCPTRTPTGRVPSTAAFCFSLNEWGAS